MDGLFLMCYNFIFLSCSPSLDQGIIVVVTIGFIVSPGGPGRSPSGDTMLSCLFRRRADKIDVNALARLIIKIMGLNLICTLCNGIGRLHQSCFIEQPLCRTLVALTHFRAVPDASTCSLPVQLVVDSTWRRHVRFGTLSSRLSSTGDLSMSPRPF